MKISRDERNGVCAPSTRKGNVFSLGSPSFHSLTPKPCVGEEVISVRSTTWPRLPRDTHYDTDSILKIKTEWWLFRIDAYQQ